MSAEENKAIARRVYEAFDRTISTGDFDALDGMIAADAVDHNPVPGQGPGLPGIKQVFREFATAFPDLSFSVDDQVAEGDKVVNRITARATHRGEFLGVPATGKATIQSGIDILRIASGKVVERWGEFDNLGLMQQIGALPPPPGGPPA